MKHHKLSEKLALALGWEQNNIGYGILDNEEEVIGIRQTAINKVPLYPTRRIYDEINGIGWCVIFDYRDWLIAGPVAEWLGVFPKMRKGKWVVFLDKYRWQEGETPQEAIAKTAIVWHSSNQLRLKPEINPNLGVNEQ